MCLLTIGYRYILFLLLLLLLLLLISLLLLLLLLLLLSLLLLLLLLGIFNELCDWKIKVRITFILFTEYRARKCQKYL